MLSGETSSFKSDITSSVEGSARKEKNNPHDGSRLFPFIRVDSF